MISFKAQYSAAARLDEIELHHMLRKGQHLESGDFANKILYPSSKQYLINFYCQIFLCNFQLL